MPRIRIITEKQVAKTLTIDKSIELAREAYFRLGRDEAINPDRIVLKVPGGVSVYCMPAYVMQRSTVIVKLARTNPLNQKKSFPTVMARIHVYDSATGEELAQVESETLTAIRTAASSAVATDLLARKDSHILGIFGTGRQAEAHIPAIEHVRKLEKIIVYSRSKEHRLDFIDHMQENVSAEILESESAEKLVKNSDILVLATNSNVPLFNGKLVNPGTHVNAIGSSLPNTREIDSELVRRSILIVDSKTQALSTYGDIMIPLKEGIIGESQIIEFGTLLVNPQIFNRRRDQITLFKAGGLAVLDAIMSDYLLTSTGPGRRSSLRIN